MKLRLILFTALSCGMLSACVADRIAFWKNDESLNKSYIINGLSGDEQTQTYLNELVEQRTQSATISEEMDRTQAIDYFEDNLKRDLQKALQAKGHYNAQITLNDIDEDEASFEISLGEQVTIANISISPAKHSKLLEELSIKSGDPLDAAKILAAQKQIYSKLQAENCAFNIAVTHKAVLDTTTNSLNLQFLVDQGTPATFGALTFAGQDKTKDSYLRKLIKWEEGVCFEKKKIEAAQDKLMSTGLFSRVKVNYPDNPEKASVIPVELELQERPARSVKAGLSYYTDEGVRIQFGWEHRNFLGGAEKLSADLSLSTVEQSLKSSLTSPFFLRNDQTLSLKAQIARKDTDAFEEISLGGGASIKRQFNKRLSANVGGNAKLTRIEEDNEPAENFGLVSTPVGITYDSRDNTLDPHKGWLLTTSIEPFFDVLGESSPFIKSQASAQTYYDVTDDLTLASRLKIGSIIGTGTEDLPATERFFSGGGGSVRGFGHQEVGPHENDDPLGGRSLAEGSLELRYKISKSYGAVAFVDAGHVGEQVFPEFKDVSVGAGVGLRYYTDFGPLRFDIGVPLTGKENTDQNYQVYISIGQAF